MDTPIVTLTTDWGEDGFFAGMVKGLLCQLIEGVRIVDVTHRLEPYNVKAATFVVRHACTGFPAGTVHIIDVATRTPFLALKAYGQYYLCCDNGLPAMVFGDHIEEAVQIEVQPNGVYNFAAYTVFARAAARLATGSPLSAIGVPAGTLMQGTVPGYMQQGEGYTLFIHFFDSYGNAYLGMSYKEFEELRAGRPFMLKIRDQEVSELSAGYYRHPASADPRHKLQLTVSATGLLELAFKEGSLQQLLGLRVYDPATLIFRN